MTEQESRRTPAEALAYCRELVGQQCEETARVVARECLADVSAVSSADAAVIEALRFYADED